MGEKLMKNNLKPKGLAISMIFEAESANYGEGVGNVASLKKLTRDKGEQYTYISRQAIRYNISEQLKENIAPVKAEGSGDKKVIQFAEEATISDYPEIDFFGYLKTEKGSGGKKRTAKVRLSNAISLETFKGDLDFLTNKGLADRIDEVYSIELDGVEKIRRVHKLLDTIAFLYRDIRGRREDLKPLFAIGGVYDIKNPIFENVLDVKDNRLVVKQIEGVMFDSIKEDTSCALIEGKFNNDNEIKEKLSALTMPEFFEGLKGKVKDYYEGK